MDRDAGARKRVLAVHNRPRETFATKEEYDAYLEMREDVIYDLSRGGPEGKKADEELKKFHAENANQVALNASAKVEEHRSKFLKIRESAYLQETAAKRARDHDRQWKLKKATHSKHEREFALGDRDDAPPSLVVNSRHDFQLPSLPAVLQLRHGPDVVDGDDLKKRRLATGVDPSAFAKRRAVRDFLDTLDAWHRPDRRAFGLPDLRPYAIALPFLLDPHDYVVPMSDD